MVVPPNAAAARVEHTCLKRGVYYFNRRVPLDVSRHYKSRHINFSLRTKSLRAAWQSVTAITAQLEGYWQHLRLRDAPVPGAHLLYAANDEQSNDGSLRYSETTDLYLRLKGQGKAETFHRAAARACRYLTEVAGDKPLSGYERKVPLVVSPFWAAERVLNQINDNPFAFPRYCSTQGHKTNSASAALNKWLKSQSSTDPIVHSFIHSFRD